jgi:hypothetical protein
MLWQRDMNKFVWTCTQQLSSSAVSKPQNGVFHFYKLEEYSKQLKPLLPPTASSYDHIPDDYQVAASLLPDLARFTKILPEALVGWSPFGSDYLNDSGTTPYGQFIEQPAFLSFMHEIIAKNVAIADTGLISRARAIGTGWVHICDERALAPFGRYFPINDIYRIPDPDDIFGTVHVANGVIEPKSYQPMPTHRLLTHLGPFQLPQAIFERLIEELYVRLSRVYK